MRVVVVAAAAIVVGFGAVAIGLVVVEAVGVVG